MLNFFEKYRDTDIFCLQEIWQGGEHAMDYYAKIWGKGITNTQIADISKILDGHCAFFYPSHEDFYGLAIFIKKSITVIEEGEIFVHKTKEDIWDKEDVNHARNLQYITFGTPKNLITVANFHGLWNGAGKEDSRERLLQSDNIANFIKQVKNSLVLCGDFNLLPETKSLKKLEILGLKNLIKEFGITSTRSNHYKKPQKFADYTFVTPDIRVKEFKMLPDEVSDHLAMYLDFECL